MRVKDPLKARTRPDDGAGVPANMLERAGVWGCLLGIVLSCKLGEYQFMLLQHAVLHYHILLIKIISNVLLNRDIY